MGEWELSPVQKALAEAFAKAYPDAEVITMDFDPVMTAEVHKYCMEIEER